MTSANEGRGAEAENHRHRRRPVGALQLFAFVFSIAGSGPAGTEGVLSNGLTLGVLGTVGFSVVWASSLAVASIELTVRHADSNGGLAVWCARAGYRRLAACVCTWEFVALASVAAVVSEGSAVYIASVTARHGSRYALGLVIVSASLAANVLPVRVTTGLCVSLSVGCALAFFCFCALSLRHARWARLVPELPAAPRWGDLVNALIFSGAGVDSMAAIVESVRDARKTVPRAFTGLCFSLAFNLLFLMAVYAGTPGPPTEWQPGFFSTAAKTAGGPAFQRLIVAAFVLSNWQTFLASMAQAAHTVAATAEMGLLPAALARRAPGSSPVGAAILSGAFALLFLLLPLRANMAIQAILYSACAAVLVFCAVALEGSMLYLPQRRPLRAALLALPLVTSAVTLALQSGTVLGGTLAAMAMSSLFMSVFLEDRGAAVRLAASQQIKL